MRLHPIAAAALCCAFVVVATRAPVAARGQGVAKKEKAQPAGKQDLAALPKAAPVTSLGPVQGRGRTKDDAEKDALDKAQTLVTRFLLRQDPPFIWTPSVKF